jgi:hypothetical protein
LRRICASPDDGAIDDDTAYFIGVDVARAWQKTDHGG